VRGEKELRALLAECARCGTCRTACTLYPERKSEKAVARGKVALLEAALDEGAEAPAPERLKGALADCLLCGKCERACPNKVKVEELVARARSAVAEETGLPAWKSLLLGEMLARPAARGAAAAFVALAQKVAGAEPQVGSGLAWRFPPFLDPTGRVLPPFPSKGFTASLGRDEAAAGEAVLFPGCVFDLVLPSVGRAAYETMSAGGRTVRVPRDLACCGLPALGAGDREAALRCVRKNVAALRATGTGPVVFPCGSCLAMFRKNLFFLLEAGDPLRAEAEELSARCVDYASHLLASGVLDALPTAPAEGAGTTGYHDPCHLSGALALSDPPREVLRRVLGGAFGEMEGADRCCGYGGTFNVKEYGTSSRIGGGKVEAAAASGTEEIVTSCSGCVLQLFDAAARSAPAVRVRHLAEVVRERLPR
jgi:glycolate oxidase iron-sulfur subunit